ncbi:Membrane protein involved in the export of O-antigen and teichoic acid [Hymenobacter daecheongensis DSM 21074]|uniref:Membrane protein involved in the export of O-antigen and teichoic acid n=1 Tax=Hymenobacter daecheongensis DSM 21074 TaxID=1121955 RepID=A0A1M6LG11_9BACT|nr:polysaccharide biosynthesis C-terminal domain-containing protein [Hymenobacter daecheongensis]SHJ70048.1 Membrane protein involved in the export of O-antigen and teichoic acid [Hymenobacter daecheongensis DSM 21074]
MSIAKKLAGQTAVYGVSSILGRVLTFLLVPLYTSKFAAAEYGVVTELFSYVAFLNILFTYGMETTYFRFAHQPGADRQALYNKVFSLLLLSSAVLSGLLLLLAGPITRVLHYPPGQEQYIVWLALVMGVDAATAIPFARLRLENKAKKVAAVRFLNILVNVGLNLFFIVLCRDVHAGQYLPHLRPLVAAVYNPDLGVGYVFLANLIANTLYIPLLWRELSDFRFRLDFGVLRPMLKYAYPLMLMGLAGMVNETLDRPLLKYWLPEGFYPGQSNMTAVGIYGACYKFAMFMTLVIQAFRYAAEPFFFAQSTEKNSPATFALILKWFTLCCAFIFVFVSLNAEDFARFLLGRPEYRAGLDIVPVLLLANLFLGMYYNLAVWFKLTDKTYFGTYISFGGAALTILLNFFLIPLIGYMGCALTTLACYFMMAVVCWVLGNKHYPIPYPMARLGLWLALAVAVVAVGWLLPVPDYWLRHAFHLGLCTVFAGLIFLVERPRKAGLPVA